MRKESISFEGIDVEERKIRKDNSYVIVVFGDPGVGKTTVATEIGLRLAADVLTSDVFRKKIFEGAPYKPWHSSEAMWAMLTRAKKILRREGTTVILDATFFSKRHRIDVDRLAKKHQRKVVWIEVKSNDPNSRNIEGNLVPRRKDASSEIGSRIVLSIDGRRSLAGQVPNLVSQIIEVRE